MTPVTHKHKVVGGTILVKWMAMKTQVYTKTEENKTKRDYSENNRNGVLTHEKYPRAGFVMLILW